MLFTGIFAKNKRQGMMLRDISKNRSKAIFSKTLDHYQAACTHFKDSKYQD